MRGGNWKYYRSKEDQTQSISQSIFVTNFPNHVTARDIWNVSNEYGVVVDAFIPYKKSKAERKASTPSHPSNSNERNLPGSYVSILKSGKTNNVMSDHVLPSLILDDSCISDRDFSLSLMGRVKDITIMPNLYIILEKKGFQNMSLTYLGGLRVLIKMVSSSAKEKLLNHTGVGSWFSSLKSACNSLVHAKKMEAYDPFICNDSYESETSDDEEDIEDDGSQSGDKVIADNDVERVSESSCMHNNDLLYGNNHKNIMPDKDKVLSDDPFNLYDILNKRKDIGDHLKYPPGFTPSVINVEEETKMKSMELVSIKTLWGNSSFDYALSSSLGNSWGILCVWKPTLFVKYNVTSSYNFLAVMGGAEEEQLSFLLSRTDGLILTNIPVRWVWLLEATGEFSVKYVRQLVDDLILPKEEVATRWVKVMPIKINVFAWRVRLDKLPTRLNSSLKGLPLDIYSLVNHHRVAKNLWEIIQLLMQGDDPIACLNKAMDFLTNVASSRFLSTNNQLRTSSNLRNWTTIQDGKVTVQQVQGRQVYSGIGYKSNATSYGENNSGGHARVVKCYNCQGERHMARQCTQPKRLRNAAWYKDKTTLAEAQEAGQILDEGQLAFLADPGVSDGQAVQTIIPNNATF
uniref:CCHC-type domain-containing protein n=1 Tax=Tanacetum cinerariifolium TaxID=118510 RepID=A0A6L2LLA8_TANCI|nr:hypothetical protein [Tanacetum cinerariifolium]